MLPLDLIGQLQQNSVDCIFLLVHPQIYRCTSINQGLKSGIFINYGDHNYKTSSVPFHLNSGAPETVFGHCSCSVGILELFGISQNLSDHGNNY